MVWWVYPLAIGAAFLFGSGSVVQQRAAAHAPPQDALSWRLLLWLVRQRLWLVGIAASVLGNLLAAVALGAGGVSLVQPLFTVRLLFALPLAAAWGRFSVPRRDWAGAVATSVGLATFIAAGHPHKGHPLAATSLSWAVAGGAIVLIVGGLVTVARRLDAAREATLLGACAGVLFGLQSSLTEVSITLLRRGLGTLLTSWQPYALVAVALYGAVLIQSAYEMAPLTASFPTLVSTEPLAGLAIGVGVLDGSLRLGPVVLTGEVLGLAVMLAGIALLASSPIVTGQLDLLQRRRDEGLAYRVATDLECRLDDMQGAADRLGVGLGIGLEGGIGRPVHGAAGRPADGAGERRHHRRRGDVTADLRVIDADLSRLHELQADMRLHRAAEAAHIAAAPPKERMMLRPLEDELDARQAAIDAWVQRLERQVAALWARCAELPTD